LSTDFEKSPVWDVKFPHFWRLVKNRNGVGIDLTTTSSGIEITAVIAFKRNQFVTIRPFLAFLPRWAGRFESVPKWAVGAAATVPEVLKLFLIGLI